VVISADPLVNDRLWVSMATLGLVAAGFALSLRTATPNLAVSAFAGLAGVLYATLMREGWPVMAAAAVAVLLVAAAGAALGTVVGLTSAPAWAVSLAGLAAALAASFTITDTSLPLTAGTIGETGMAMWALIFIAVSVGGGLLWLIPAVGDRLSANRLAGAPARFEPARLVGALVGMTGSSLLAGVGGVVVAAHLKQAGPFGGDQLFEAVGAVLLGGASVYGGRGGIAGTAVGVAFISMVTFALVVESVPASLLIAVPAVAIVVGVVVSRVMEVVAPQPRSPLPTAASSGWADL
jgi:ribose transport system permease protein